MDGPSIAGTMVRSSKQVYDYIDFRQLIDDPPPGMSETRVDSYDVRDGYAVLHLASRLSDASGLILKVDSDLIDEDDAGFTRYDEISKTIVVRPGEDVLERMRGCPEVSVMTDMKFLIMAVCEFYRRYGDLIRIPDQSTHHVQPVFPESGSASSQQEDAVHKILSNRMSYVWGAPGTGKTQFVLSTCIRGCLNAGERIAVFAPTNNSVEQVLRGILRSFPDGQVPDGIVRLGVPTRAFLKEHPEMCEDRQAQRRLDDCLRSLENMEEVLYERSCDSIRGDLDRLISLRGGAWDGDDLVSRHPDLAESLHRVLRVAEARPVTEIIVMSDERPLSESLRLLKDAMFRRQRPATAISEFDDWTDGDISDKIAELRAEAETYRLRSTGDRISKASIIAGTPHQFISRFRPRGSDEDGRMELDVDRIFLDEAGYCGLVQALTLFSCGVPVSMLGDHMQLPPVSQLDDEVIRPNVENGGSLSEAFLWNLPALFAETMLTDDYSIVRTAYLEHGPPAFRLTARKDLTMSHRFGGNLGKVLDRYVYRNGMTGSGNGDLEMLYIDAKCGSRENRDNSGEADAIADLLRRESPDEASVCILTPYSVQCSMIKSRSPKKYSDSIMTVHGSQGREWDTVILSVADNGVLSRDVPFRFTSSGTEIGLKVINTAVSRAKKRLIVVCDREFWLSREGELISGLLRECVPYVG